MRRVKPAIILRPPAELFIGGLSRRALALHRGVSHKANGPAGPPSDPFKARPLWGPCASASPLLPRTLLQMSKNIDLALSDKVVPGTMSLCRRDKERWKKEKKNADLYLGHS